MLSAEHFTPATPPFESLEVNVPAVTWETNREGQEVCILFDVLLKSC